MQVNNRTHFFSEFGTHFVIMKYSKNAFIHSNEHNVYFFQKAYNKQRLTKNEVKQKQNKTKQNHKQTWLRKMHVSFEMNMSKQPPALVSDSLLWLWRTHCPLHRTRTLLWSWSHVCKRGDETCTCLCGVCQNQTTPGCLGASCLWSRLLSQGSPGTQA